MPIEIDLEHLHPDAVARVDHRARILDELLAQLGNVDQTILVNSNIDEGAKVGDVGDNAGTDHSRHQVSDGVQVVPEGEGGEGLARVATRLLQLTDDIIEGELTDVEAGRIIDGIIAPQLKAGNPDAAVIDGASAIVSELSAAPGETVTIDATATGTTGSTGGNLLFGFISIVFFLFAMVMFVIRGRQRGFGNVASNILFVAVTAMRSSSGGGRGGFSGGGGGGFSGGGASGSW